MIPEKTIWCPNVILLNEQNSSLHDQEHIIQIIKLLPKNIPFVFVTLGDFTTSLQRSQIIIEQLGYSIFKEMDTTLNTLTSKIFKMGIQYTYYIHTETELLKLAFIHFLDILGTDYPIICLAPNLSTKLQPALQVDFLNSQEIVIRFNSDKRLICKTISIKQFIDLELKFKDRKLVFNQQIV